MCRLTRMFVTLFRRLRVLGAFRHGFAVPGIGGRPRGRGLGKIKKESRLGRFERALRGHLWWQLDDLTTFGGLAGVGDTQALRLTHFGQTLVRLFQRRRDERILAFVVGAVLCLWCLLEVTLRRLVLCLDFGGGLQGRRGASDGGLLVGETEWRARGPGRLWRPWLGRRVGMRRFACRALVAASSSSSTSGVCKRQRHRGGFATHCGREMRWATGPAARPSS